MRFLSRNIMSREKGAIAEKKAGDFLKQRGFEIVEYNFFSKYGEIDIIALKDNIVHFVEVKSGVNFNPVYAITAKKIERILKTIKYYILLNSLDLPYCIDAICIKDGSISFIENITF
ncbi:YraN family protein [Helicobacter anatolicus]|uniref:YraN family protein n=1 Tax=Helicobacter anatolicus TaxID=2905874 RepID=UPI001E4DD3D6|nr:YraN family protein [Helicobacter anatolicus]MCE3039354.1 YraN family protein [Helicobacter anatolicus]